MQVPLLLGDAGLTLNSCSECLALWFENTQIITDILSALHP